MRGFGWVAIVCCSASTVWAGLASHELLVLVNRNSLDSKTVANHFIHSRQVPSQNIIYLDIPDRVLEPRAELSPAEFTRHLWDPIQQVLAERELNDHLLAWVYSVDFPVRITTTPATSLMGMTLLRNQFPDDAELVDKGRYRSPYFVGPDAVEAPAALGGSFYRFRQTFPDPLPIPSMMLGYTGARGNSMETVLRTIRDGRIADHTAPRRSVFWITGEDVRAKTREWQFQPAREELKPTGIHAQIQSEWPREQTTIIGLQMGAMDVRPDRLDRLLPGAMAEHLTSFGALFHDPRQTKLTEWLRAGATASAGTVVEPYAIWTKFPHARFFAHYARGNTMIESFYLATGSPLQLLIVGEPLARPWTLPGSLMLVSVETPPLRGPATFALGRLPEIPNLRHVYRIFLNGKWVSDSSGDQSFSFDTRDLPDGHHELRAIAYAELPMVHSAMARLDLDIDNNGQRVTILSPAARSEVELYESLTVTASVTGEPILAGLFLHEEELATAVPIEGQVQWTIAPARLGIGPVALQVRATYAEAIAVRSAPQWITVKARQPHPMLADAAEWGEVKWSPHRKNVRIASGDGYENRDQGFLFTPGQADGFSTAFFPSMPVQDRHVRRYQMRLQLADAERLPVAKGLAGLIWNVQGEHEFDYFLIDGASSAWIMGRHSGDRLRTAVHRGKPIRTSQTYELAIVFEPDQTTAFVDGEWIASLPHGLGDGPEANFGVLARHLPVTFSQSKWLVRPIESGDKR